MTQLVTFFEDGKNQEDIEKELLEAFAQIPFGNSMFQIGKIVLSKESPERKYRQALLEIKEKWIALKEKQFLSRRLEVEIRQLNAKILNAKDDDERELAQIDLDEKTFRERMVIDLISDALIELRAYYNVYKNLRDLIGKGKPVTREQFEQSEPEYWKRRAVQQAERDLIAAGNVSAGNVELLQQVGFDPHVAVAELMFESVIKRKALIAEEEKKLLKETGDDVASN